MLERTIPPGAKAERLSRAVKRLMPELPAWAAREAFKKRDVLLNGRRASAEDIAKPGDIVRVYADVKEEAPEIVFEDAAYIVLHKPQGMPTQGEGGSAEATLSRQAGFPIFACHRLDAQTGGLLLMAKTATARERAELAFRQHEVQKRYRCLVRGIPSPREATLRAYLVKDADAARVSVYDNPRPGALPIETRYRVLEAGAEVSHVEVEPMTGRTHQIRAQMAHIGHPILGDDKYGDRALNRRLRARRQKLWAVGLTLWDGRAFEVEAPF